MTTISREDDSNTVHGVYEGATDTLCKQWVGAPGVVFTLDLLSVTCQQCIAIDLQEAQKAYSNSKPQKAYGEKAKPVAIAELEALREGEQALALEINCLKKENDRLRVSLNQAAEHLDRTNFITNEIFDKSRKLLENLLPKNGDKPFTFYKLVVQIGTHVATLKNRIENLEETYENDAPDDLGLDEVGRGHPQSFETATAFLLRTFEERVTSLEKAVAKLVSEQLVFVRRTGPKKAVHVPGVLSKPKSDDDQDDGE